MTVHLDIGGGVPRCRCNAVKWSRKAKSWRMSMFAADVTCLRCIALHLEHPQDLNPVTGEPTPQAKTIPDESDRDAWLDWRRGGLGGSDMGAILRLSPWSTPFDVWLSKTEGLDIGDSRAMWMGRKLERAVGEMAAEQLGLELVEVGPAVHPEHRVARGTADFMLSDGSGLECKTTRNGKADEPPMTHEIQVRWYMEIYDVDVWHIATLHRGSELSIHTLRRDREMGAKLIRKGVAWWERHIIGGEPVAIEGASASAYLHRKHQHPAGVQDGVLAEDYDEALFAAWQHASATAKAAAEERDRYALELKRRIGDAHGLKGKGWSLKWSRWEQRRTDFASLKADPARAAALEELCAPYTSTTPTGRLVPTLEQS